MVDQVLEGIAARSGGGAPPTPAQPSGGEGRPRDGVFGDSAQVLLWAFLGTVAMLFLGFSSALVLRRASPDWQPLEAPSLLWATSAVLMLSSVTIETARRKLRGWNLPGADRWLWATGILGALFVGGQLLAWRELAAMGVFLASNPHSSFFYVLTGVHVVHVLGGLLWFGIVAHRLHRLKLTPGEDGLKLLATYWHFLGILWLYLLYLLFLY